MIFEMHLVATSNLRMLETNLTPTNMHEHDDPTKVPKYYLNTGMKTVPNLLGWTDLESAGSWIYTYIDLKLTTMKIQHES